METTVSQYSWSLLSQRDGFGDNWRKSGPLLMEKKRQILMEFSVFSFSIFTAIPRQKSQNISL